MKAPLHTRALAVALAPMLALALASALVLAPAAARASGTMPGMDMPDDAAFAMLVIDQLEAAHDNHGGNSQFVDGEFWYGKDFDKLWLKAEGEFASHRLEDLRGEALWDHAIAPYWSTQLGVREDTGDGPHRTWAAFGVQGLAPWWLATELTGYVGGNGGAAARLQLEYEARFTQRLVLQPRLEAEFYGKDDPQRAIGAGLSSSELGLRLRYAVRREFAPYLGVVWRQRYGETANLNRAQDNPTSEMQIVLGLHAWY